MRRAACLLVLSLAQLAVVASAQTTIDGSAAWTVDRNASSSNGQSNTNSSFWQNYALGYASSLWDPQIVKYKTEGLFRTNSLTSAGTGQDVQQGRQGDFGYKLGAALFPASAFPFSVQATRDISGSSGDLGPSNPIRSGMIVPSGAPPVDFESRNKSLTLGWQLGLGDLPRVELGYHQGNSVVNGGSYRTQQDDEDLSAAAKIIAAVASAECSTTSESPSRISPLPSASTAPCSPCWAPSRVTRTPSSSSGRTGTSGRRTASTP